MSRRPFLSASDVEASRKAHLHLTRLGPGATLEDVFATIRSAVALSGCFLESYTEARPWGAAHTSAAIPGELTDAMMAQRGEESQEPLRIVAQAPAGILINAHEAMPESAWEEIQSYQLLVRNGFAHVGALKMRTVGIGLHRVHTYLALFRPPEAGPFDGTDTAIIESLHEPIRGVLDRMAVPLLNRPGMLGLAQLIQEQRGAFISLSRERGTRVLEMNRAACVLAARYAAALGVLERRNVVPEFVARIMRLPISSHCGRRQVPHHERSCGLSITEMCLDPAAYDLPERTTLLLLEEVQLSPFGNPPDIAHAKMLRELPPRMRQVVHALVYSGKDRKVIAQELGISVETLHTEIKTIFRRFRVNRRSELIDRLR